MLDPEQYKEGNAIAGIKNWNNMSIFKANFLERMLKMGINNPRKFLEENACDEYGVLYLDKANQAMEKLISAPAKINLDVEGFKQSMKESHSQDGTPKEKLITPDLLPREIMYNIPDTPIPEESSQNDSEKLFAQM